MSWAEDEGYDAYDKNDFNRRKRMADTKASGTIQQAKMSQSGKSLSVLINEVWYSTKAFELNTMVGATIDFEYSTSEFNGNKMNWLNAYTPVTQQGGNQSAPQQQTPAPSGSSGELPMPFISNVVAHAIQANKIQNPSDITAWANGALQAYQQLGK